MTKILGVEIVYRYVIAVHPQLPQRQANHCKLCEIFMDTFDYPWRLSKQLEIARARMKEAAAKANITAG